MNNKENHDVTYVGLKLNLRTDNDIIKAIGSDKTRRQENLKALMRKGAAFQNLNQQCQEE